MTERITSKLTGIEPSIQEVEFYREDKLNGKGRYRFEMSDNHKNFEFITKRELLRNQGWARQSEPYELEYHGDFEGEVEYSIADGTESFEITTKLFATEDDKGERRLYLGFYGLNGSNTLEEYRDTQVENDFMLAALLDGRRQGIPLQEIAEIELEKRERDVSKTSLGEL